MATQIGETGSFKKAAKGGKGSVIPDVEPEDPQRRLRARGPSPDEGRFTPMECDTYNGAESRDANLCSKDQRAAEEEQWESYYSELFDDDLSEQAEARLEDRGSKGNKVSENSQNARSNRLMTASRYIIIAFPEMMQDIIIVLISETKQASWVGQ